jgi:FMN phosphatase YigB (HAD superfamily)
MGAHTTIWFAWLNSREQRFQQANGGRISVDSYIRIMIKTILFDFGNVVAFFDHQRAIRQLLAYTDQTAEDLTRILYYDHLETQYECGQLTTQEVFNAVCKLGHLRCNLDVFVRMFCDIFWPNPPVADLIPRLAAQGYRLVLASNTNEAHYAHYRQVFADILKHFSAIVVSHEAGARKPNEGFFLHAQKFVQCEPNECLFIDDLADNTLAAQAFGWNTVQYVNFDTLMVAFAEHGIRV